MQLLNSLTQEIRVSVDDSTVPLLVTGDDKSSHSHVKKAYIGFNSKYQPNDSDFEIPPECQSCSGQGSHCSSSSLHSPV